MMEGGGRRCEEGREEKNREGQVNTSRRKEKGKGGEDEKMWTHPVLKFWCRPCMMLTSPKDMLDNKDILQNTDLNECVIQFATSKHRRLLFYDHKLKMLCGGEKALFY
jgi:hypothetical protein